MSEDSEDKVGYRRPPKEHQFKKGEKSRNPAGRRPRRPKLLVSSELRRTLLEILDEEMVINTPNGPRTITQFEGVLRNLVNNAAQGKPTSLNQLMRVLPAYLQDRETAHPQVTVAEYLRTEFEKPVPPEEVGIEAVTAHIAATKEKY